MKKRKIPAKVQAVSEKIISAYNPDKVILFGSYAWGKPHSDSDVDLLIIKKTKTPRLNRAEELRKKVYPLPSPVDMLIYTPSEVKKKIEEDENLFIEDIVRNGTVIYEKNSIRKRLVPFRRRRHTRS